MMSNKISLQSICTDCDWQVTKTNEVLKELVYANVTDSAAHWELYFNKRWKGLALELSAWLENKYAHSCEKAQLENFIDVRSVVD